MSEGAEAPPVVAVVITRDPGWWLEESLEALGSQDYGAIDVLVAVAGGREDPSARIARALPGAFVRKAGEALSFSQAANDAMASVQGATFFLVCHDDCAPERSAVRLMVEESFRSNAGVVSPKMVTWEDPLMLLHVGMNVDKTGAVVDRVHPPEIDHGQHDGVREVFVAPGGFTLLRADLIEALGGLDGAIEAMAEDLDLCWRAQVAGARVVVAPEAKVRHLEVTPAGVDPVTKSGERAVTPQAFQRRHELRAVLKCYGAWHLARVLPQALALCVGEIFVALVAGDRLRAAAIANAWRWNFAHRAELRAARRQVQSTRRVPDGALRRNQLHGSARLSRYVSNVSHLGLEVTHARVGGRVVEEDTEPELTGTIAGAFSEDESFDEDWDDRGRRLSSRRTRVLATRRSRLIAGLVIALVLVIGLRHVISGPIPALGQFLPLYSWTSTWHQFFSSWQPAGVGTTAPSTPAFAGLGILGTLLLGAMGLTQKVIIVGSIPIGAWGASRLLRPFASPRASIVGAGAYLGLPLCYDALGHGRLDGLVAFALAPWLIASVMASTDFAPFGSSLGRHGRRAPRAALVETAVLLAVSMAFAPAMVIVLVVAVVGLLIGSAAAGRMRGAGRAVRTASGALGLALILCAPWVVGILSAGTQAVGIFGLRSASTSAPSLASLIHFDLGLVGGSPLGWLLVAAGLLPLVIGSGPRFAWAVRLWSMAIVSWLLTWVVVRGWTGSLAPSVFVLLVPAALGVAACVGLGVAAFETDLFGHRFGWRQLATTVMLAAAVVGVLPVVAELPNGSFGLPATGFSAPLQFLQAQPPASYRVLWLGDPAALPGGGWSAGEGLAYSTSQDGPAGADNLFAPAGPGPAASLGKAVELAELGRTVHLGRLLAPAAIRYVVVVRALAPEMVGIQSAPRYGTTPRLGAALAQQVDLRQVPGGEGFSLYMNEDYLDQRAWRSAPALPSATERQVDGVSVPGASSLRGWGPAALTPDASGSFSGALAPGTLYSATAPGGSFSLTSGAKTLKARAAFSWASQFQTTAPSHAVLSFSGAPLGAVGGILELLAWCMVVLMLMERRLGLRAKFRSLSAGRKSGGDPPDAPGSGPPRGQRGAVALR
ncbi:MAG: glycosyltransferase [Acidimicrobiales bacterium]